MCPPTVVPPRCRSSSPPLCQKHDAEANITSASSVTNRNARGTVAPPGGWSATRAERGESNPDRRSVRAGVRVTPVAADRGNLHRGMARRWAVPIVVLAAAAAAMGAPPSDKRPSAPDRIERTPEFVQAVNAAIDRGAAWLRKAQAADGSFPEFPEFPGATTALGYCTLRVCGAARDDAAAKSAWASLRRDYRKKDLKTYTAAVYLMAIAEHGERIPGAADEHDVKLTPDEAKWAEEIVRTLVEGQDQEGCWAYEADGVASRSGAQMPNVYDHSNTQYALLGLKSAARCGIRIEASVWTKALAHFLATQEAKGPEVPRRGAAPKDGNVRGSTTATVKDHARGWCYRGKPTPPVTGKTNAPRPGADPPQPAYGAMTAGAVSSLVICRSELADTHEMTAKMDVDSERAVWDGLAWLGTNWQPNALLGPSGDLPPQLLDAMGSGLSLYEFYGVERAGVLAAVEWMADLDWYGGGASSLLQTQRPDGSWSGLDAGLMVANLAGRKTAFHTIDTCFALLFLKKGTVPVKRGAVTRSGDDTDINFGAAASLTGKDLEDFLDLVFARWRRTEDEDVKGRLLDGAASAGPRIVEPLLVRMDSPDPARRLAAHALLLRATGLDFGYDADGDPASRESAVVKWQMWWMGAKDRIAYDPAAKRLVVR